MAFEFNTCKLAYGTEVKGLYEIQPKIFGDARGYFLETYSEKDFFAAGLKMKFVQDNQSKSSKGVLRGLHFQTRHPQGKFVRTLQGIDYSKRCTMLQLIREKALKLLVIITVLFWMPKSRTCSTY